MERKRIDDSRRIQVLSELVNRALLASRLGVDTYSGDRDVYKALGYPTTLRFDDYYARYCRQDIAKAIIDRPVRATWQGALELIESNEAESTPFETQWEKLDWELGIKSKLARVDRLTGLGRYGVLLLGLNDVTNARTDLEKPVSPKAKKLLYIKPLSEKSATISTWVDDPKDVRYGLPLLYEVAIEDNNGNATTTIKVHHSRIVHIVDEPLESEVYGRPRLEAVYNRLIDLEKVIGGDGEMFWRGARPGYQGKIDKDYQMTEGTKQDLKDQIDEFENNLRRILVNEGMELEALAQQIADPTSHVNVNMQMISAVTGIPQRILSGSERGELASTQDITEWLSYVQTRREEHAEPRIIRPFVDKLIELGILPAPSQAYRVKWQDLFAISEKARVDVGRLRADALRNYTYSPIAMDILPPPLFLELCLGLDKSQIELAYSMREAAIKEEQNSFSEEDQEGNEEGNEGVTGNE